MFVQNIFHSFDKIRLYKQKATTYYHETYLSLDCQLATGECSHLHHLHVEVVRYPSQVANIISWVRTGTTMPWQEEFAALKQVDGEYEDLVPCKNLPHTIPTSQAKRNQPLVLDKPRNRKVFNKEHKIFEVTFRHLTGIWLDQRDEDL